MDAASTGVRALSRNTVTAGVATYGDVYHEPARGSARVRKGQAMPGGGAMTAPGTGDFVARWVYAERANVESALRGGGAAEGDLDDLVQVVALAAVRTAEQERPVWATRDAFRSWLQVVAYRVAVTHAQRVARERRYRATVPRGVDAAPSAEDRYRAAEELRLLERSTTPERWRTVTALAAGEDVSEVAREAGLTAPGIYSRVYVARRDFAAALAREATAPRVRRKR